MYEIKKEVNPQVGTGYRHELARLLMDPDVDIEISPILGEVAHANYKRPAYAQFFVADKWITNINGSENLVDGYLCMRIPIEAIRKTNDSKAPAPPVYNVLEEAAPAAIDELTVSPLEA